jgi:YidC/Oxa1 family membrane protein insertase|tara:strand:+ start:3401 stop:4738 length:1338 start_codon:yes stop_codon:yes gene_type:complete
MGFAPIGFGATNGGRRKNVIGAHHRAIAIGAFAGSGQIRHASSGGWFGRGSDKTSEQAVASSSASDTLNLGSGSESALSDAAANALSSFDANALAATAHVGGEVAAIAGDSWYTTSALMYAIEYFHVAHSLEWWQAIVATTLVMRLVSVPLTVMQQKNAARMHLAKPEIEAINKLAQTHSGDKEALERYQGEIWKIWQKYDCNPVKMFAPLVVQAPVFISFFIAIQRMSVGVPSFTHGGGQAWFTDLSVADPTYVLPLISSLTFLASVETNPPSGADPNAQPGMKWGMRGLAAVMIPLTCSFPQGVFVYWVTTNLFSFGQAQLLRIPALKKLAGIPDVPVVTTAAARPTAGGARKITEKFGQSPTLSAANPRVSLRWLKSPWEPVLFPSPVLPEANKQHHKTVHLCVRYNTLYRVHRYTVWDLGTPHVPQEPNLTSRMTKANPER